MNFIFALLILLALAMLCLWISFGAGNQMFINSSGPATNRTYFAVNPTFGRIFFGGFGILMLGVTIAVAILQGRKMLHPKNN